MGQKIRCFLECSLAKGRLYEGYIIGEAGLVLDVAMEFIHSLDRSKGLVGYLLCVREWA